MKSFMIESKNISYWVEIDIFGFSYLNNIDTSIKQKLLR